MPQSCPRLHTSHPLLNIPASGGQQNQLQMLLPGFEPLHGGIPSYLFSSYITV